MKYIIDIPSELLIKDDGYSFSDGKSYCVTGNLSKLTPYVEPDRKAIEDEVWKFVNFLENKLMASDYDDIFDDNSPYDHMTYQEAKSKYEAWLKQKDEIHVGDEVQNASHKKGIVLNHHISLSNGLEYVRVLYMDDDGNSFTSAWEKNNVKKTGRHFPEVAELLEKMRGEEE